MTRLLEDGTTRLLEDGEDRTTEDFSPVVPEPDPPKYIPLAHGPLSLRSLYHWVYKNLIGVGTQIGDDTDQKLEDHENDPNGHPAFAGAGTTGFVPDPVVENHKALTDTGAYRQATKVFFQPTEPTPAESAPGDLWLVTS